MVGIVGREASALTGSVMEMSMGETEEFGVTDDGLDVGDDGPGMDEGPGDGGSRPVSVCGVDKGFADRGGLGGRELIRVYTTTTIEGRGRAGLEIPGPGVETGMGKTQKAEDCPSRKSRSEPVHEGDDGTSDLGDSN